MTNGSQDGHKNPALDVRADGTIRTDRRYIDCLHAETVASIYVGDDLIANMNSI